VPKGERERDPSGVWMSVYWWRKRAITVGEVKNIFCREVARYVKGSGGEWHPEVVKKFKEAIRVVEDADRVFGPIRDALGAHVRPANAKKVKPKVDPTPMVLRRHRDEEFEVVLDLGTSQATSLCHVTATAFMFAWSDATRQGDYASLRLELHEKFMLAFNAIRHGIDLLLGIQWKKAGLLK